MKNKKLYKCRQDQKLTQKEIAEELSITAAYYSMIENGMRVPSYLLILKISEFFNKKPDYFFEHPINKELNKKFK